VPMLGGGESPGGDTLTMRVEILDGGGSPLSLAFVAPPSFGLTRWRRLADRPVRGLAQNVSARQSLLQVAERLQAFEQLGVE
jgi:hypothetical protein